MSAMEAIVAWNGDASPEMGDHFLVEVHGPKLKVVFTGQLVLIEGTMGRLVIQGEIQYLPATEPVRYTIKDISGIIDWEGSESAPAKVIDFSEDGVSLVVGDVIAPGTIATVRIKHGKVPIQMRGLVRYCRELNDGLGNCRVGLRIIHEDRLNSARWQVLFSELQSAA